MAVQTWVSRSVLLLIGLWILLSCLVKLIAEILWFNEVGYLSVFLLRTATQGLLGLIGVGISLTFLLGNLKLADQFKYPSLPHSERHPKKSYFAPQSPPPRQALGLGFLLLFLLGLGLLLGLICLHYSQVFITYWHPNLEHAMVLPSLPKRFGVELIFQFFRSITYQFWQLIILGLLISWLFWKTSSFLISISVILSLGFGLVLGSHWDNLLQYLNPSFFNKLEDIFNKDISFYIFNLPLAHLLEFWLSGLFLYGLVACSLIYLLSGNSFSQGSFPGFTQPQQRHLHGLAGLFMLSVALHYWLARYELLYSTRGIVFGASYTDVHIQGTANIILAILAIGISIFLFWQAIFSVKSIQPYLNLLFRRFKLIKLRSRRKSPNWSRLFADTYSLRTILGWYIIVVILLAGVLPTAVQRFIVQPNELERELPYIERSIAFTRQAFNLDQIEVQTFDPTSELTYTDLQKNNLTVKNIRLWDTRPLLQTNRQLQQIRLYYEFLDADIDRYTLLKPPEQQTPQERTEKQQVIIAARELDYEAVPDKAKTWVNEHLVYTHGYGFTLSPVNTVAPGGLPEYFVKNIGADPQLNSDSPLEVSAKIKDSIPIGYPRIYYGQLTQTNIMTPTPVKELDYPLGNENVYNTYDGEGGILVGTGWRRLLFAKYLNNWQMLFTDNFTADTKILFRRNIIDRVKAIAPFLHYDSDPYLVVTNANLNPEKNNFESSDDHNYLYWIIDAYTTSNHYPYSDPEEGEFNYIRNSVKVVIDAYNGGVKFYYLNTPTDPLITTWRKIFPTLFQPIQEMPASLYAHIRYPVDLFRIQSERLLTYHMEDPQVFYNREDLWRVPREIYGNQQQPVEPYYLIMRLPTETKEEFVLLQPFTPASRINLIAWLAARSDGNQYGKLLLYQFPKQRLVLGPEQVEALINQEPEISEQISLWNRQGSRVIQGNLLVIPIEQSLLYVEPLYLEATENSLPTLVRVIVAYGNRIVMRPSLDEALRAVFEKEPVTVPFITPLQDLETELNQS